jgi:hypothetical protein
LPPLVRVREERLPGDLPLYMHPEWHERFPWLAQGTTARGAAGGDDFDLRLFGDAPVGLVVDRWRLLRAALGVSRAAHARQVHGTAILVHGGGSPGLVVSERFDGHATDRPDILLTVSVADCVPISIVDGRGRGIAMLHGGWRGVAAGILERGVELLGRLADARPADLHVHLGPAICGHCYEVGPEVFRALGLPEPAAPTPVDLRAQVARRALALGVPDDHVTVSEHCTRCGDAPFFSHRAGCHQRQVGFLAIRPS